MNKHIPGGPDSLRSLPKVSVRRPSHRREDRVDQILAHLRGPGICSCGLRFGRDAEWAQHLADVLFAIRT